MAEAAPAFRTLEVTPRFEKAVKDLARHRPAVAKQVQERVKLLFDNPAHPSLEAHRIKPDRHYWEAYVNRGDRIIYRPDGAHLLLVDVVKHDDIGRYGKSPPR